MPPKAEDFKVNTLMAVLRSMNLSVGGTKEELISRLNSADPSGRWIFVAQVMAVADLNQCLSTIGINEIPNAESGVKAPDSEDEYSDSDSDATDVLGDDDDGLEIATPVKRKGDTAARDAEVLERELLAAREEIERLRSAANSNATPTLRDLKKSEADEKVSQRHLGLNNIQELLNKFDGNREYFDTWISQVRLLKENYELSERETTVIMVSRLKGRAYRWFHSKSDHVNMGLEELINEMTKMYGRADDVLERRKRFDTRTWKPNETFREYHHHKKILAKKVPIDPSEIISYLIAGIPNGNIRNQLRLQKLTTEMEILGAMEDITLPQGNKQNTKKNETSNRGGNPKINAAAAIQSNVSGQSSGAFKKKFEGKERGPPHCFNCNTSGHMSYECKEPKRKRGSCFTCGSMEHKAWDCKQKPNKNQKQPETADKEAAPHIVRTLSVTVIEAQLATNYGFVRMDPYVKLRVGNLMYITETDPNGATTPHWNEELRCDLLPGVTEMYIEVWDKNSFTPDEIIAWGDINIPPAIIQKKQSQEYWFPLSGQQGDDKEGHICLKLRYSEQEKKKKKKRNAPRKA